MAQNKAECGQYTAMIGLVYISPELLGEDIENVDLVLAKELLMNKALNFNNHLRSIFQWIDPPKTADPKRSFSQRFSEYFTGRPSAGSNKPDEGCSLSSMVSTSIESYKDSPQPVSKHTNLVNKLKNLNRHEFFVYSASLSFNPSIKSASDLLNPSAGGGIVFTITAKMPVDAAKRGIYLKLLQQYLGKNTVLLEVKPQRAPEVDSILSTTKVAKEQPPADNSAVLKPIPKYFDEDYTDDEQPEPKPAKDPSVAYPYSFFRHSSYMFSKFATSTLVPHEDDKYVTERLLQVKLQKKRRS